MSAFRSAGVSLALGLAVTSVQLQAAEQGQLWKSHTRMHDADGKLMHEGTDEECLPEDWMDSNPFDIEDESDCEPPEYQRSRKQIKASLSCVDGSGEATLDILSDTKVRLSAKIASDRGTYIIYADSEYAGECEMEEPESYEEDWPEDEEPLYEEDQGQE